MLKLNVSFPFPVFFTWNEYVRVSPGKPDWSEGERTVTSIPANCFTAVVTLAVSVFVELPWDVPRIWTGKETSAEANSPALTVMSTCFISPFTRNIVDTVNSTLHPGSEL